MTWAWLWRVRRVGSNVLAYLHPGLYIRLANRIVLLALAVIPELVNDQARRFLDFVQLRFAVRAFDHFDEDVAAGHRYLPFWREIMNAAPPIMRSGSTLFGPEAPARSAFMIGIVLGAQDGPVLVR